eukprot:scaffold181533_cov56-Cyclotella_meneghiniana.AAC.1
MNSEFNSSNTGEFNNFMKTSSLKSIHKQMKVHRRGISLPKLSAFVSVCDYETVISKHQLRQEKLEICLPECDISSLSCNRGKLFDCVKKVDEYSMAALTAGGFISMSYDYSSSSKAGKGSSSSDSNDWSMSYGSSKSSKGYSMSYDYSSSSKAGKGSSSSDSNDWSMCYGSSKSSNGYSMSYDYSSSSKAGKGSSSGSDSNEPTMTYSPTSSS